MTRLWPIGGWGGGGRFLSARLMVLNGGGHGILKVFSLRKSDLNWFLVSKINKNHSKYHGHRHLIPSLYIGKADKNPWYPKSIVKSFKIVWLPPLSTRYVTPDFRQKVSAAKRRPQRRPLRLRPVAVAFGSGAGVWRRPLRLRPVGGVGWWPVGGGAVSECVFLIVMWAAVRTVAGQRKAC